MLPLRCLVVIAITAVLTTTSVFSQTVFRSGVDLVHVTVTVSDGHGGSVGDLKQEDFSVLDDGSPQEILSFSAERVPVSLGIVLDVSGSMTVQKLNAARTAIRRFANELLVPEDELFLAAFAYRTFLLQSWTTDRKVLGNALEQAGAINGKPLQYGSGTAIYDAVRSALPVAATGAHRKKALLLVSDGDDSNSRTALMELQGIIRSSEVLVYALGVEDGATITGERLREITDPTGGRTEIVRGFKNLDAATSRLAAELNRQYVLGYSMPHEKDGKWHGIRVEVNRKGATVRARAGYIG